MVRLHHAWEEIRTSYWFVPGFLSFLGALLAAAAIFIDRYALSGRISGFNVPLLVDLSGARTLLSTIAASSMTVAGVVFSITIVVLIMASNQFGPRLLHNFMHHVGTQSVLGIFIGTFIYSLFILSSLRQSQAPFTEPRVSVIVALTLGAACSIALIYFIHHVSLYIQAERVLDNVALSLEASLKRTFPEIGDDTPQPLSRAEREQLHHNLENSSITIHSPQSGYIQAVDSSGLLHYAKSENVHLLEVLCLPGEFVAVGSEIARIVPSQEGDPNADTSNEKTEKDYNVARFLVLGPERTPPQDPAFAVDQLVEVALRALSPGVNDPFTAINCMDRLGAALSLLAPRALPQDYFRDDEGRVCLLLKRFTHASIVTASFSQIRQAAAGNVTVTTRLLEIITMLAKRNPPPNFRQALLHQAQAIQQDSLQYLASELDRRTIQLLYETAHNALAKPSPTPNA